MSCFTCRDCGSINLLLLESRFKATQSSDSLVSQILRGQRPVLDAEHTLLTAEIVELEQQHSVYAAQLEEIQLRQCAVLKALESRKSIYAPIHRLPRDILIEIFHSVCDSWWQEKRSPHVHHSLHVSGPLWVLGRVCGLWRDTLHSSPASWARKLVVREPFSKHALEILQTYLEHTGEHLLNLQVSCRDSTDDDILSLLVQSCQRWKILRIDIVKSGMLHFESISHLPALQAIEIYIYNAHGSDDRWDMCLGAPQLWHARLQGHGIHQIRLPPGITNFSGSITCPEDLRLFSQLRNLRRCHLWMTPAMVTTEAFPVVTVAQLTHLYVDGADILNFLSAPLLGSLTINPLTQRPQSSSAQEYITRFLHRSRCHLESLSIGKEVFTLDTSTRMFALEACSTISRLKLELHPGLINGIVEALTSPSVLPNLHHLILCLFKPSGDEYVTLLPLVRSRSHAGSLKLVEVQYIQERYDRSLENDIRAHTGDGDLEMRVGKWDPPGRDVYLWHLP
ncbi:uncharacterized protein ARMOST_19638 [Armillaria ostoyae]|uniref:F-box domain-containing protein n=1 Tax=Armillaria ostoyae TaxID=47428 RepID=A0A284S534_ARMOS|nr:uncharacterized protein ARMOST_19638 [Armillaria ostoyae]